jgi:hypothetical protein
MRVALCILLAVRSQTSSTLLCVDHRFSRGEAEPMKTLREKILLVCLLASVWGCGSRPQGLNTQPLTEEQKAAVRAEDAAIDEAESPGNRTRKMTKGAGTR